MTLEIRIIHETNDIKITGVKRKRKNDYSNILVDKRFRTQKYLGDDRNENVNITNTLWNFA